MDNRKTQSVRWIFWLLMFNIAASLFHFLHNMIYFDAYPNEPEWLSPGRIDIVWLVITPLGLLGYLLYCRRRHFASLLLLYLYGLMGLGGLGHYLLAPISAHTLMMNLSILLESAAALLLLGYVGAMQFTSRRSRGGRVTS